MAAATPATAQEYTFTTLAGPPEAGPGAIDGTGSAARFVTPSGVAVDSAGNVYVAATYNCAIRIGTTETCPDAPTIDLAVGPVGQLRQLDTSPQTAVAWQWSVIRRPGGSSALLPAANVRNPTFTPDVPDLHIFRLEATNAAGSICIRALPFTAVWLPPSILTPPLTQTAEIGSPAAFWVEVTNTVPGTTYQWYFDGTNALAGATNSCVELPQVQDPQVGAYTVVVRDAYGAVTNTAATLGMIPPVPRRTVPALCLSGGLGSFLNLSCADSLTGSLSWQPLDTVILTNPPQLYLDLSQPLPPCRPYRAWQTNAPSLPPSLAVGMASELTLTGAIGSQARIDYLNQFGPTDAWVTLDTVTLTDATQPYFDLAMWRQPTRLYRLVPVP
jgi:hypothetical protein